MSLAGTCFARLHRAGTSLLAALLVAVFVGWPLPARSTDLLVFAAASQRDALEAVIEAYRPHEPHRIRASYQSSSVLARQIEQGAPADLYISANAGWMDYLQERGLIDSASRTDLFGNELVLIAARDHRFAGVRVEPGFGLADLLGDRRLAVGDPEHVPAGLYAEEAMKALGVWDSLAPKLARADNARSALALVSRGETPLGIVYASDAAADKSVEVVGRIPVHSHARIVYPAAVTAHSKSADAAKAFLDFLGRPEAARIFARHGFRILGPALN